MPIRIAVVGMGMSATVFHGPFLQALPQFELHTVVERSATPEHSKARDAFGSAVKVVTTLDEALRDADIDAVWVLTINSTHYDFVKQSLEAGKHVIVEKPVTPTSAEAYELAQLATEKNLVLAVYQNRRWDADFLTIKKLIADGSFGAISEFQSNFDRFRNEAAVTKVWKEKDLPGSGLAYDLGSHLVDQLVDLFGPPDRVTARLINSRLIGNPSVPDSFKIQLEYSPAPDQSPSRALPLIATAQSSSLSLLNPQQRFLVKGTGASFVKYGLDPQEDHLKQFGKTAVQDPKFGIESQDRYGKLYRVEDAGKVPIEVPSEQGNYKAWFENVAEAIENGDRTKLIVKPEQAALTIKVIELAIQSSNEGRTIKFEP
ncbi:uncharacterized protein JCM15063_000251 [Sporobolomyces koalae]|uniref:uncharacterized protein n=1 Tax=Sporobolomyces koalae TaxID=500713 RepID=UPI00317B6A3E